MTKIRTKICMVTTNNLDYDTRILNEAEVLSADFDVLIFTTGFSPISAKKWSFRVKEVRTFSFWPNLINRFFNLFPIMLAVWREQTDIFHAHDLPGLLCVWPAAVCRRKYLVYDSHELWSSVALFGIWRLFRLPFDLLERLLISKVKAVITVNKSLAKILTNKYHKPTLAIYNYPEINSQQKKQNLVNQDGKKSILYIGAFRPGRGLMQIIRAAQLLDDSYQVLFIGYGPLRDKLEQEIIKRNLTQRVSVVNALPPDQLIATIKNAHVGFCLIENACLSYYYSSPNKLFQYIAAQVPILASNFPEYKEIVLANGVGETVDVTNYQEIAQKIIFMTQRANQKKYRQNLVQLAVKKYNWAKESKKLLSFYRELSQKKLKIVVDINHPAHVHFFKNFIWAMQKRGHEILITASQKDITFQLLDYYGFSYVKLGGYGKSFIQKFINVPYLDLVMFQAVKKFKPDIFIGIGSVRAAHVSKILGKPSIIFDDSEPASFGQFLYRPFADRIYTPTCFRKKLGKNQVYYNGFHELAYLTSKYFRPDEDIVRDLKINQKKNIFVMRFVSWRAVHDIGQHGLSEKEKIFLAKFLSKYGEVIISLEKDLPALIKKNYARKIAPEKMHSILQRATLLVTDSQTMATEAAILGTPVIRCNSFVGPSDMGNFIELEKKYDLIYSFSKFAQALEKIKLLLNNDHLKNDWRKKSQKLIKDKIDVTDLMIKSVEQLAKFK